MLGKGIIIIVDDVWADTYQKVLEDKGYFVVTYKTGEESRDAIHEGLKYGLLVSDLSLHDGFEIRVEGSDVLRNF